MTAALVLIRELEGEWIARFALDSIGEAARLLVDLDRDRERIIDELRDLVETAIAVLEEHTAGAAPADLLPRGNRVSPVASIGSA